MFLRSADQTAQLGIREHVGVGDLFDVKQAKYRAGRAPRRATSRPGRVEAITWEVGSDTNCWFPSCPARSFTISSKGPGRTRQVQ